MSDEPRTPAAIREARLKSALRDNLRRRKAQARDRDEAKLGGGQPDDARAGAPGTAPGPRGGSDRDG